MNVATAEREAVARELLRDGRGALARAAEVAHDGAGDAERIDAVWL